MEKYNVLGHVVYYDERSSCFFYAKPSEADIASLPSVADLSSRLKVKKTSYTFCIEISERCNLACDYCFNASKKGRVMSSVEAIGYLERLFSIFPDGEKYVVDLSGVGEPLLVLNTIVRIAQWCHRQQDKIKKEVLPQFVCNGTLLSQPIVDILQKNGVLFGVSLDGVQAIHDQHRKTRDGAPTFQTILNNIEKIENRQYIGCACTITKDVFDLTDAISFLSRYFQTLSFRPARGDLGLDEVSEQKWEKEYDKLTSKLVKDVDVGDISTFRRLMNGDDYFGKYLTRSFANSRVVTRCDACITRFAVDINGLVSGCPASQGSYNLEDSLVENSVILEERERCFCTECPFKFWCGGECQVVLASKKRPDSVLCKFKKHLIVLAGFLACYAFEINESLAIQLRDFSIEKLNRLKVNRELTSFLTAHPGLSFTEAKALFDKTYPKY